MSKTTTRIGQVATVIIPVADVDRAIEFYVEHARLREAHRRAVRRRLPLGRGRAVRRRDHDRDLRRRRPRATPAATRDRHRAARPTTSTPARRAEGQRRRRRRRGQPHGRPGAADVLVPRPRGQLADGRAALSHQPASGPAVSPGPSTGRASSAPRDQVDVVGVDQVRRRPAVEVVLGHALLGEALVALASRRSPSATSSVSKRMLSWLPK